MPRKTSATPSKKKTTSRKTSFYLDETIEGILAAREGAPAPSRRHGRRSQTIGTMLRRYDELCHADIPDLTHEDWHTVIEAGRTWSVPTESGSTSVLLTTLAEAGSRRPASQQHTALVEKIMGFTTGQRIAIVDFVERFWAAKDRGAATPPLPAPPARTPSRRGSSPALSSRS